jgi:hypothetical protein
MARWPIKCHILTGQRDKACTGGDASGIFFPARRKKTPRTDRCQVNDMRKKIICILPVAGNTSSLNESGRVYGQAPQAIFL